MKSRGAMLPVAPDIVVGADGWPARPELVRLVRRALAAAAAEAGFAARRGARPDLTVAFLDDAALRALNARWRGKDKPTNVLSFPAAPAPGRRALGDIALAAETVMREAGEEGKRFDDHLAHLVIHGFLHLLGHDHETDAEAERMEALERSALARLDIADPYALSERRERGRP